MNDLPLPSGFPKLLEDIKDRIRLAQTRAMQAVNAELVRVYWDIGRMIDKRQQEEGWGAGVIPRLARELRNDMPEVKGFSERNIKSMLAFHRAYPEPSAIVQQAAAQLPDKPASPPVAKSHVTAIVQQAVAQLADKPISPTVVAQSRSGEQVPQAAAKLPNSLLWSVPWAHHVILIEKVKDLPTRLWYMQQTLANGWSRNVLLTMIQTEAHRRQGRAISNFDRILPPPQSDLARQILKDPYIFDFLTLEEPFRERELELNLLSHLERFLLELGQGFAFVGRQVRLQVGDKDFSVDLLFYHLKLRCFVVIDLKTGEFKPEYAGKMNFYLGVVDDQFRHESNAPSIGLILCQDRNHIVAEYALRGVNKPIGVSEYELTRALPPSLQSALPSVEQIEAELAVSDSLQFTDKAEVEVMKAKKAAPTKPKRSATNKKVKKVRRA
jgi:predicted nuclease of restriction endonuclease-like (RecB) superfamily